MWMCSLEERGSGRQSRLRERTQCELGSAGPNSMPPGALKHEGHDSWQGDGCSTPGAVGHWPQVARWGGAWKPWVQKIPLGQKQYLREG